jgi:iron complex outermembrane receptor protein
MPSLLPQSQRLLTLGLCGQVLAALLLSLLALGTISRVANAQSQLPALVVEGQKKKAAPKKAAKAGASETAPQSTAANPAAAPSGGSLTVPTTAKATAEVERTPGGVAVVPDTAFKNSPANTIKDVLGWVPGVVVQPRWGPDGRVSIRGSGLTRNFGNRGINVYMDGIPINTADGLFDLFEVDPSAYRYVEVYKGANALRYGANSLGGAINFVTPTGRDASPFETRVDAGSFGYVRSQTSTGAASGAWDYFVNLSAQREDGYREHNQNDMERLNANLGYRLSADAETRFYLNANSWRAQLPGEVTKDAALNSPRTANSEFVRQDQQRNIDSLRVANKTTLRFGPTTVDFGIFTHQRHVDHPIFRYLDYDVADYGGFVRSTDDRMIGGFRNRLIVGLNVVDGTIDYREFENKTGAVKGSLVTSALWNSQNHSAYAENSFYVLPNVALIVGGQFLHAVRDQRDRFFDDDPIVDGVVDDDSGRRTWNIFSPKAGVLWDVAPGWQVFANVSRSAEVPTFDANTFSAPASSNVDAQTATTYEIGTRGRRPDFSWDFALYRAELENEFQCLATSPFSLCNVVNADHTVHQGVEAGFGVAFLKSIYAREDRFWFNLAYTYNDFHFDNDAKWGNNRLPGVAPHNVRAEVLYKHPNGFYAGPNVEWMPQAFFADNANSLTVDPFALLNFRVGYVQTAGWSGYLEGRNLLDKHYISTTITAEKADVTSELFNPGTGLAIYGGLQYKW